MPRRHRKMRKGGFLGFGEDSTSSDPNSSTMDSLGNTLSGWGSSISQGASSAWEKTKNATSGAYNSVTGSTPTPTPSYGMGGRKRSKKMRGGFSDYTATSGLAAHASPVSDIQTAKPNTWVGGRTRKHRRHSRKHRHSKSCKRNRKH